MVKLTSVAKVAKFKTNSKKYYIKCNTNLSLWRGERDKIEELKL